MTSNQSARWVHIGLVKSFAEATALAKAPHCGYSVTGMVKRAANGGWNAFKDQDELEAQVDLDVEGLEQSDRMSILGHEERAWYETLGHQYQAEPLASEIKEELYDSLLERSRSEEDGWYYDDNDS